MNSLGVNFTGCPGPPHRLLDARAKLSRAIKGENMVPTNMLESQPKQPKKPQMLSAKELTGAPLISYVPKHRKVKKKISEPFEKGSKSSLQVRQRHISDQNLTSQAQVHNFYQGQNLYQKMMADQGFAYVQDFYRNPSFSVVHRQTVSYHQQSMLRKETFSKSFDNLSDTLSISSDESDNFKPRIIRPRRRRKKEKRHMPPVSVSEEVCLGSEKQCLPTGLLSAESSFDSRSESGNSEEESPPIKPRRKLASTLSVPAYSSYMHMENNNLKFGSPSSGSDYCSMTSTTNESPPTSPPSSSYEPLFDSDSGSTESVPENYQSMDQLPIGSSAQRSGHKPLKMTKSTSCSFFQSPKVGHKGVTIGNERLEKHQSIPLRKTNSWAFTTNCNTERISNGTEGGEFSLFLPGRSIDLLSGIRKHLSRLDLQDEEEN